MSSLGERVRLLRTRNKLNMEELAEKLVLPVYDKESGEIIGSKSTSKASISNLEKDKHRPNVDLAIAIADYFDVSLDWLLRGENYTPKKSKDNLNWLFDNKTDDSDTVFKYNHRHEAVASKIKESDQLQNLIRDALAAYFDTEEFSKIRANIVEMQYISNLRKKEGS
ncbi:helix-turn-helix transcriptional regulator [Paenibacillus polymyxa]|uniref:helix-turn-helix domain-containing protein n=1 Tax=Paenibacillus polymyxa TaxID=1406 RepID=UPI002AB454D2|nr:helix-turn-helix transcriptional regulator [Paenibacillus polymyxa]MDY8021306.1 helix-turn-helix transcriptional regulator [Paenibacillus polymyxa]